MACRAVAKPRSPRGPALSAERTSIRVASCHHHIDVLNHVSLIAAAVPLRGRLVLSVIAGGPDLQAVVSLCHGRPLDTPEPPRVLAKVGAERRIAPRFS